MQTEGDPGRQAVTAEGAPAKIGKYEIRRELGRGAMGMVYEGHDPFIERRVAIKTIRQDLLDDEQAQEMVARFKREAQAAGKLTHPNIVSVYEYGEDQGMSFIAMEYVEGSELRAFFSKGSRFKLKDVIYIMRQILSALDYSHRQGVVHRDIKPSNVIVMPGLLIKITDFGIAHVDSSTLTVAGSVMGTPTHMSPEQFMGQPVDGRSDIFSAGVILYEFLTGENPFTGSSHTSIMHKVLKLSPIDPSELNAHITPEFDAVVHKALAKRPPDRFQSAREFAGALYRAYQGEAAIKADETPAPTRNVSGDTTVPLARTPTGAQRVPTDPGRVPTNPGVSQSNPGTLPPGCDAFSWDPEILATAEKRLARHIGPLAKILVRKTAATAGSVSILYEMLATHIEIEADRREFLASGRKG